MPVLYLVLTWAILGLLAGALALAARLKPTSWSGRGWLWLLALGLGSALLGGLLGFWLLGRLFSTAAALWIAVLVLCLPRLVDALRTRRGSQQ
jgi:uncharacterized membrane protein YeaQ/YmgE (transglycosylase-associated protein family)